MSIRRRILQSICTISIITFVESAAADQIILRNGQAITGEVQKTDDGYIVHKVAGDIHVAAADVDKVVKSAHIDPATKSETPAARPALAVKIVEPKVTDPNDGDAVRRALGRACTFQYVSISKGKLRALAAGPIDVDDVAEAARMAEAFGASSDASVRNLAGECYQITLMNWRLNRRTSRT